MLPTARRSLPLILLFALVPALAWAAELKLRILETTDVHMNLLNYDYYQDKVTHEYGLAKTITLLKAARAEAKNSLLIDNGDLIQGSPLGDLVARIKPLPQGQLHPAYKVMNQMGYDAANIGNHEFNFGLAFLRQAIAGANFPYVSANVRTVTAGVTDPAKLPYAFTPYVILDRKFVDEAGATQNLKVGVIGFVPPQILQWDKAHLEGRVIATDIVETAAALVPEMRAKGAQLVIAVPHSGFERGDLPRFAENSVSKLSDVPGIDAILFGHAHAEFPSKAFAQHPKVNIDKGTINGVPSVMPGRWGDNLGIIDLVLEKSGSNAWKVKDSQSTLRPVWDRANRKPLVDADPMVEKAIAAEHQGTLDYVRAEIARTTAPIHSYFAQVADDPSVQVVSLAQFAYGRKAMRGTEYEQLPLLSAAAPFKTGGRQGFSYYTDVPEGPIAVRNVADIYLYPNTIKAVKVTGAQVREWLEMSAQAFNRIDPKGAPEQELINAAFPSFNFDVIDGVTYRIDVTQASRYDRSGKVVDEAARRIVDLRFEGKPIDDKQAFIVVTNNYRAGGGGNFPALDGKNIVMDAPDENREAIVQYLASEKRFNPSADGNWSIVPVPGVKLRFVSGAAGTKYLAMNPKIKLVKDNGDGSAVYEVVP